jgi:hypothetical protein
MLVISNKEKKTKEKKTKEKKTKEKKTKKKKKASLINSPYMRDEKGEIGESGVEK